MPRSTDGRRELRAHVAHELRALGDTHDEVARRLEGAAVRGTPGDVTDCALAVYLSAVVAADPRVRCLYVGPVRVFIRRDRPRWWPWIGVGLPKALCRFVEHFDRGAYPALVRVPAGAHERPAHVPH